MTKLKYKFDRLDVDVIASGSAGNAVFIKEKGASKGVLVDIGIAWKRLEPYSLMIDTVFLTHRHLDHYRVSTMDKLKLYNPTVVFVDPVGSEIKYKSDVSMPHHKWATLKGKYKAMAIPTPHSVPNVAWIIKFSNGATYFHATDTASLDHISIKGCDVYGIECNYSDLEELTDRGSGNETIAVTTHLSTEEAQAWFTKNAGENSRFIPLHEHKTFR